ncbi:MAG TPA: hypothetical protein PLA50_12465 [Bacteroidia bacterium]|nr:hypothetical protein [Bacteroidia bacterium]
MSAPPTQPKPFLSRHPWLWVVVAFLLLIVAWSTLITLAVRHAPDEIDPAVSVSP